STLALRVPHLWTISLTCCLFPTPPTIDISTLSLHDALPILDGVYISEKVGAAKPSAKIFEAALRDLGLTDRSKVLVVGDDLLADSRGGANAGFDTCWVNFDGRENDTAIRPTYTIDCYAALCHIQIAPENLENIGSGNR